MLFYFNSSNCSQHWSESCSDAWLYPRRCWTPWCILGTHTNMASPLQTKHENKSTPWNIIIYIIGCKLDQEQIFKNVRNIKSNFIFWFIKHYIERLVRQNLHNAWSGKTFIDLIEIIMSLKVALFTITNISQETS